MFNSFKKAISGIFGSRVVAKPRRRNVIALPVKAPAVNDESSLVDARLNFLVVLEEILAGKKDAESEAIDEILDLLHEGFCDGDYCTGNLEIEIESLGLAFPDWDDDDERWSALAAAIEYFAGALPVDVQTLEYALYVIASGEYRHIVETHENYAGVTLRVEDDETLGRFIAEGKFDCDDDTWEYLESFFDFEACGRDYRESVHGKFTAYGFFAEL